MAASSEGTCGRCGHYVDDPDELERELVGLTILSSARGDARGDQGLCRLHGQLLVPTMTCWRFEERQISRARS